jgi:hypothetical protein
MEKKMGREMEKKMRKEMEKENDKKYSDYVKELTESNWIRERITIHENLSSLVVIKNLEANKEGTVIDIKCPPGTILSIMGKNNPETINDHFFEAIFVGDNGNEISPDTNIKILKKKVLKDYLELDDIKYKDIGILDYSDSQEKFKNNLDLFRFKNDIKLKGEDHLNVYVVKPDINITDIKFNLKADLWTQDI